MVALGSALGLGAANSCGGALPPEPTSAANATELETGGGQDVDSAAKRGEAEQDLSGAPKTSANASSPDDGSEAQPPTALEVRYHVSSEGLRVTVSGVEFEPTATPIRVGSGWGVRIDVKARARDDAPHVLFQPEQGPMAFFAVVDRGGRREEQGDQRRGRGEEYVTADGIEFSRTWPGDTGMKSLAAGDKLELQVGLWGVGTSMTRHRPLKGFFTVTMMGGAEPQAVISPPVTAR